MYQDFFILSVTRKELLLLIALLESLDHSRIDFDSSKVFTDLLIRFNDKLGGK